MVRSILLCVAALAALATGARGEDTVSDLRCVVVAGAMSQNTDPKVQNAGLMASLYYLGKLDGREPNLDLEARLKQEMANMKPQDMMAEAQRCGGQRARMLRTTTSAIATSGNMYVQ